MAICEVKRTTSNCCTVIKFGGSVTTNKNGRYDLREQAVLACSRAIAELLSKRRENLVLVFGGGSFGNVAPIDYGLLVGDPCDGHSSKPYMMTTIMQGMLEKIITQMESLVTNLFPFQASSWVSRDVNGALVANTYPIACAISNGMIPVVCGDIIFRESGGYEILSSDFIPPLLARGIPVRKALYYSDVDGIYTVEDRTKIVREVTDKNIDIVRTYAGVSHHQDVTGGMQTKLLAMLDLASHGVPSELLNFKYISNLLETIICDGKYGTYVAPSKGQV